MRLFPRGLLYDIKDLINLNMGRWQFVKLTKVNILRLLKVQLISELCVGPWMQQIGMGFFFCLQQHFCLAGRSAEERVSCHIWIVVVGSLKADRWTDQRAAAAQVSDPLCRHETRVPAGSLMRTWAAVWPLTSEEVWWPVWTADMFFNSDPRRL